MSAAERPTIGVSCYWRQAHFGAWTLDAALVGQGYIEGVRLAGGRTLVLPPDPEWIDDPADAIDRVDGLLLAGGDDIDPSLWGVAERHPALGPASPRRDSVEPALLRCAIEQGKPVLGICRGMQLINVVLGGTLTQHMEDTIDQRPHRADDSTYGRHRLLTVPGTRVAAMCDAADVVYSHHHMAVDELAPGLIVSARAEDGVIEGIELADDGAFCVGVLWHPDAAHDSTGATVFAALVEAARQSREERQGATTTA
ncbi:MAG: gamma-glutamyl-gamma-aminobutyrate hydrolase family protein [Solirubrobacterales bacterium]